MSKNVREGFEKRSRPLQRLNGLQFRKPKTSTLSSSSSSSSESPNGGSRFLLSLNSCTSTSSRTHLHRQPRNLPLKSSTVTLKPRSKENEVPRISSSEKFMKSQPLRLDKKQCGEANRKATIKIGQSPKLCSAPADPVGNFKKVSKNCGDNGSGEVPIKLFGDSTKCINSISIGNCTPEGRASSVCGLDSVSIDYVEDDPNSKTAVKTPPVEASVSPEIQYGYRSTMAVLNSGATPVCYGASHLLSGVTDKRKCRRRGNLKGGCQKVNFFQDENNCENGSIESRDSLVPLPSEASVRWFSSPCHEDSEQCDAIDISAFGCGNRDIEMHEHLLVTTPNPVSNRNSVIENNSALSLGSLSTGNIIRTPSSGPSPSSSSFGRLGGSEVDLVQFELDSNSILGTLNKVGPWPSSVSLLSEDMDLSSSIGLSQVHENENSVYSWVSDSTVENLALSQMKISWRDGFFSNNDKNDELDCCRCLSDEEIDDNRGSGGDREIDLALSSSLRSRLGTEPGENDTRLYKDGHTPFISAQGNAKLSSYRLNESAESICTNGDGLVASGESDWMYFRENHLA